eukprot:XP_001707428.1 Hypothetical protein GL50803_9189 [Giardia lamblia ATCC 50803]
MHAPVLASEFNERRCARAFTSCIAAVVSTVTNHWLRMLGIVEASAEVAQTVPGCNVVVSTPTGGYLRARIYCAGSVPIADLVRCTVGDAARGDTKVRLDQNHPRDARAYIVCVITRAKLRATALYSGVAVRTAGDLTNSIVRVVACLARALIGRSLRRVHTGGIIGNSGPAAVIVLSRPAAVIFDAVCVGCDGGESVRSRILFITSSTNRTVSCWIIS